MEISLKHIQKGQFYLMECHASGRYFEIIKVINNNGKIQIISNAQDIKNQRDIANSFNLKAYVDIVKITKKDGWIKKQGDSTTDIRGFYILDQKILKEMVEKEKAGKEETIKKHQKAARDFKKAMKRVGLL